MPPGQPPILEFFSDHLVTSVALDIDNTIGSIHITYTIQYIQSGHRMPDLVNKIHLGSETLLGSWRELLVEEVEIESRRVD